MGFERRQRMLLRNFAMQNCSGRGTDYVFHITFFRPPSASSFENSKLAQPVIARRFFTWTPADIFTQFCRAKLQRTGNRLCLSYYVPPSAALWNPALFVYFNFLGELISDIYKKRKSRHPDYRLIWGKLISVAAICILFVCEDFLQ